MEEGGLLAAFFVGESPKGRMIRLAQVIHQVFHRGRCRLRIGLLDSADHLDMQITTPCVEAAEPEPPGPDVSMVRHEDAG